MSRLTYNEPNGDWGIVGMNEENRDKKMYGVACKLLDYEKTELSPDQVDQMKYKVEDFEKVVARYKKISDLDLMILESLPSLYKFEDFEIEAILNICEVLRRNE